MVPEALSLLSVKWNVKKTVIPYFQYAVCPLKILNLLQSQQKGNPFM